MFRVRGIGFLVPVQGEGDWVHSSSLTRVGSRVVGESLRSDLESCPELPTRHQQVDVVAAHKVLGEVHYGAHERRLPVVVGGMFRNVPSQLRHLSPRKIIPPTPSGMRGG